MRRRITFAILGTLAVALVLVGLGTLALTRVTAKADTERNLRSQAEGTAELIPVVFRSTRPLAQANRSRLLKKLRLQGIGFIAIAPDGTISGGPDLPDGVTEADVDVAALQAGDTVSGSHGSLVYAMAARDRTVNVGAAARTTQVVVLTRTVESRTRGSGWFLLASGIVLLLGAAVAWWVSRTLTEPLRRADDATRRLAAGDLSARVPDPDATADDELADLARSINAMAETMERSRGLERQFLLSVSHDLRTPLTSIRGYAEALTDGTAPDPNQAGSVILSQSRRLERLVRDLLELATVESRQFTLRPEPLNVSQVVAGTAEGFRPKVEAEGLRLVVDADETGAVSTVDPDRLGQIVANLVENAIRYAATTVRVSTTPEPSTVAVRVADDGPGIAPPTCPTSSSGSTWRSTSPSARSPAPASVWPSSGSWPTPWGAPWPPNLPSPAPPAPASSSACRADHPGKPARQRGSSRISAGAEPPSQTTETSAGGATRRATEARATPVDELVTEPTSCSPTVSDAPTGTVTSPATTTPRTRRGTLPPRLSMRATSSWPVKQPLVKLTDASMTA